MVSRLPPVKRSLPSLRRALTELRRRNASLALVPTMGALHQGHLSLVRLAQQRARRVVVSIFVNPAQFAPHEDFATYPRSFDADLAALAAAGADLIWAPTVETMYPKGFATRIVPGGPADVGLEDTFRPHFFGGVATVVAKLLLQCRPDVAVFGEKDFQQLLVIRRLVADLDLPVKIVGAPIVRERGRPRHVLAQRLPRTDERAARSDALPRACGTARARIARGDGSTRARRGTRRDRAGRLCARLPRGAPRRARCADRGAGRRADPAPRRRHASAARA